MPGANVMEYITFRAIMAFVFALVVTMLIGGKIIRYLRRKKIGDEPRDLGVDDLESKKRCADNGWNHHIHVNTYPGSSFLQVIKYICFTPNWNNSYSNRSWIH